VIGQRTEVEMGFADRHGICRLAAPITEAGMGVNLAKVEVHFFGELYIPE
jgi:hypothetical protein